MNENKFPYKMQKENEQYPEGYLFGIICLVGSFAESNVFYRVYVAQNQYLSEVGLKLTYQVYCIHVIKILHKSIMHISYSVICLYTIDF